MAASAVDIGSLDITIPEKVDPLNPSVDMAYPLPETVILMDSANGLPEDEQNNSKMVDTDIKDSNHTEISPPSETPSNDEKVKDTETQPKSLDSKMDDDNQSREAEQAFLDLFNNSEKMDGSVRVANDYILTHEATLPMEWRIKNGKNLSLALGVYLRLMEDRISNLETSGGLLAKAGGTSEGLLAKTGGTSGELLAKNEEASDSEEKKEDLPVPKTMAVLKRKEWPEFKRAHDENRNMNEEYAIDILIGDPIIPHDVWRYRKNEERNTRLLRGYESHTLIPNMLEKAQIVTQDTKLQSTKSPEALREPYPSMPDRIRINGIPLKELLEKALEAGFKSSCSAVFLKPYKLLVQHESQIRQIYKQLKQKFTDTDAQEGKTPDDDEKSENILETHGTEQAFKELSCLIEFMDNDLKGLKQLREATVSKASFSDLWHIFYPGCVVITSQEPINAYRVFYVTGGRSYLSPPEEKEERHSYDLTKPYRIPDKASDLLVACYQIDFDGKKFGPVSHSFSLQKYDDFRDITSLPIYPLEFAKRSAKIQETLTANGKTFLDICKGEHVQYRGINLHEAEEIDSEVVVDFQAALWNPQDKDKDSGWNYAIQFGIKPPTVNNKAEVLMVSSSGCKEPHCCENEVVFDDLAIDHQRMEDFLTDKPWLTTDLRHLNDNHKRIPKGDLILFPHRLFAFVLKDRKWAVIDINNVKRVPEPKLEAWKSLVLPEGHKEMVYSIVQSHFRDKKRLGPEDETQTDLIRGKGLDYPPPWCSWSREDVDSRYNVLLKYANDLSILSLAEILA
ncbi:hypothetical protein V8C40DRAFT_276731 [Trichoderma camerunense]